MPPSRGNARRHGSSERHGKPSRPSARKRYIRKTKPAKPATVWLPSRWRCTVAQARQRTNEERCAELVTRGRRRKLRTHGRRTLAPHKLGSRARMQPCQKFPFSTQSAAASRGCSTGTRREPHSAMTAVAEVYCSGTTPAKNAAVAMARGRLGISNLRNQMEQAEERIAALIARAHASSQR